MAPPVKRVERSTGVDFNHAASAGRGALARQSQFAQRRGRGQTNSVFTVSTSAAITYKLSWKHYTRRHAQGPS